MGCAQSVELSLVLFLFERVGLLEAARSAHDRVPMNLFFAPAFSCAILFPGMISIATKRITISTSMSTSSTKAKKTIFASGAWRNS